MNKWINPEVLEQYTPVWLISDTHFWHENIIRYCKRPFRDLAHMHAELIRLWNESIQPNDIVIHLGDFSCGGNFEMNKEIVDQLNGYKILIMGNHDRRSVGWFYRAGFDRVFKHRWLIGDYLFSHIPNEIATLNELGNPTNIHGHSHKHQYGRPFYNAGVDLHEFKPQKMLLNIKEQDFYEKCD